MPGRIVIVCVLFATTIALSGCGSMMGHSAQEPAPQVNYSQPTTYAWEGDALIAQSHVAADGMIANLESRLPRGVRILAATFVNRDNFDESSAFGRLVAAQYVTRLSQAGFGVMEIRLRSEMGIRVREGEFALSRKTAQYMRQNFDASAILVGDYTVDDAGVFVSSRLVRLDTGVVVAAYDFVVPNQGMVTRLLDDGTEDVVFAKYLRQRAYGPVAEASMQAPAAGFAPLVQEFPLIPVAPPTEQDGPTPVPGPFRLFPPASLQ
ncbi:FlgO family outer membrane protein [Desulfovibrio ferrophilus]|uniref:FlgO domain-containing protein n=1 Tax=Desulfovibrio ferrophilus TaxID=241368 RepID=A0A2Z6AW61_9BACT|nr:FlgO family outer membrane protein [Desulfovibrio ferrophilus]BBD07416.1 uncharacterized protein DFE_0690 [Desulfovibrio ferrophilus]